MVLGILGCLPAGLMAMELAVEATDRPTTPSADPDEERALRRARLWAGTTCLLHALAMIGMWGLFGAAFVRGDGVYLDEEPYRLSAAAQGAVWILHRGWVLLLFLPIDYDILFRLARSGAGGLKNARRFSYAVFAGLVVLPVLIGPEAMHSLIELFHRIDHDLP
jgi:hypothetical protein